MDTKELIFKLTENYGVSGDEFPACKTAANILSEYAKTEIDHFGNVIGYVGEVDKSKNTLLLDAHIDEIGLIVTYISDDGFLKVSNCGGIDRRLLLAQEVTVLGRKNISGVITSTPPHLEADDTKTPEIDNIYIDTGYTKEQLEEFVSLGDRIVFPAKAVILNCDQITGKSLDDRSGVAVILKTLEILKGKDLPVNLAVLFSSQEETGERGAKTAAFKIAPDYAVAIDVSFALTADDKPHKCGKLGKGPMIGVAPSLSRKMSDKFISLAKEENIPYQIEVMNGQTGTNADAIGVSGCGVKTVTLSIPLKYMHTPVEVISISDIENSAKLLAAFVEKGVE